MSTSSITTIIPTYRRPSLLVRAIRSVLDQTYPNFQVCVYDNASNDGTAEVVEGLARRDSRVRYHCHPENIGSQENFRIGVSLVDTPFCNILSDDDFLLPKFFDQAMSALQRNPDAALFFGGILSADPGGQVIGFDRFGFGAEQTCSPPRLFNLLAPNTRTWTSILFRRSTLESLGGLKRETSYAADTDLILRCATRFKMVLSDTPCAVFTIHPASISVGGFSKAFESTLNLSFFESVNRSIDLACEEGTIDECEAAEMKALYRTLTVRNLFRNSFSLITRNHLSLAARTSGVLATSFKRYDLAALIRLATLDNGVGALMRAGIRYVKVARKPWFAGKSRALYSSHSELVKTRILQLTEATADYQYAEVKPAYP